MKAGLVRRVILTIHLIAGLSAALVLIVIGLTGVALAFRDNYVCWVYPSFWSVERGAKPLSEDAMVAAVETEYAPARVTTDIFGTDIAHLFFMDKHGGVFVNRYNGEILDAHTGESWTSKLVINAFNLHTKLAGGRIGQIAVDVATFETLLLVPTGFILWWRTKRKSVKWSAGWHRVFWDLHNCAGIVGALPIIFLAITGALIALKIPSSSFAESNPPLKLPEARSVRPADAATRAPVTLDSIIAAADVALPGARILQIQYPEAPWSTYVVRKRAGGWGSKGPNSDVSVNRYTGEVVRVDDAREYTASFRWYQLAKKLHSGDVFGLFGRTVLAIGSLILAVSAFTGIALGLKKLAGMWKRFRSSRPASKTG